MEKKKILYILSNISKAVAFEWIVEQFEESTEFELEFVLLNKDFETPLAEFLKDNKVKLHQISLTSKAKLPLVWLKLFFIILKLKPKIVHTHLFEASLLGLSAAKLAGVKKRIYTRHHSTSHHQFFPKAVKYDKFINRLSTKVIAISNNVKQVLEKKENVASNKIVLVEHGFKLELFDKVNEERVNTLMDRHNIPNDKIIIGVISRFLELKGIHHILNATKELLINNAMHIVIANASGSYEKEILQILETIPPDNYTLIKFEEDLFALYKTFDYFIHCPIDTEVEAFGQTYVEALAAGIPSIFTLSGIANDFILNKRNALVVEHKNPLMIKEALETLLEDKELSESLIKAGKQDVKRFDLQNMIDNLSNLYRN